ASNNIIGGTTPAARNVASGNNVGGIHVVGTTAAPATGNRIQGNFVGVNAAGTGAVGVRLGGGAFGTLQGNFAFGIEISGGNATGAGNRVAFNGSAGVAVFGNPLPKDAPNPVPASLFNTGNSILGNVIFSNGGRAPASATGIDLVTQSAFAVDDGVTPNTP